jgi:drug/metabolite transporter (DMT)-like permease
MVFAATFPVLGPAMKQTTRDNLIYLGVALSIVALLVADLSYADIHGQKMWWPSKFAFRAVYTTLLLAYFVGREVRRRRGSLVRVLACILFACIVHLAVIFGFSQTVAQLSGLSFSALAVWEMFLTFVLSMAVVPYLLSQ